MDRNKIKLQNIYIYIVLVSQISISRNFSEKAMCVLNIIIYSQWFSD